ncbi:hypothetical protein DLAC_02793 [Tieghemostelium lacteum]|uniref:Uncharacterized protein n=1 Tax=Tieghemostelium lacteum TaxID=361077 RepID=A0A152A3G0_TIELA|nr:hypothetical protein DLAC_02793 [Tieghemostelium lacteum]|eukprot:KYR00750.1 hypothetical protein DLAC_02793 [Tieghemostelium lacteum]
MNTTMLPKYLVIAILRNISSLKNVRGYRGLYKRLNMVCKDWKDNLLPMMNYTDITVANTFTIKYLEGKNIKNVPILLWYLDGGTWGKYKDDWYRYIEKIHLPMDYLNIPCLIPSKATKELQFTFGLLSNASITNLNRLCTKEVLESINTIVYTINAVDNYNEITDLLPQALELHQLDMLTFNGVDPRSFPVRGIGSLSKLRIHSLRLVNITIENCEVHNLLSLTTLKNLTTSNLKLRKDSTDEIDGNIKSILQYLSGKTSLENFELLSQKRQYFSIDDMVTMLNNNKSLKTINLQGVLLESPSVIRNYSIENNTLELFTWNDIQNGFSISDPKFSTSLFSMWSCPSNLREISLTTPVADSIHLTHMHPNCTSLKVASLDGLVDLKLPKLNKFLLKTTRNHTTETEYQNELQCIHKLIENHSSSLTKISVVKPINFLDAINIIRSYGFIQSLTFIELGTKDEFCIKTLVDALIENPSLHSLYMNQDKQINIHILPDITRLINGNNRLMNFHLPFLHQQLETTQSINDFKSCVHNNYENMLEYIFHPCKETKSILKQFVIKSQ